MAKLDIIIPHYREPVSIMDPMLGILKLQRNVDFNDFRVLVINDGEDIEMPDDFGADCPFEVEVISIPHAGVSAVRNKGMEYSKAEWVMFCDADDAFLTTISIMTFMRYMTEDKVCVCSAFYEESRIWENGNVRMNLVWHAGKDWIFVHGKAFRRQWLIDNRIFFRDDITTHEDAYFIALTKYHLAKRDAVYINIPLYLWQCNPVSVTRVHRNFVLDTYGQLCRKNSALVEELLFRGMAKPANAIVCRTVTDSYYRFKSDWWDIPENKEKIADAERWVAWFLRKHADRYFGSSERLRYIRVPEEDKNAYVEWLEHIVKDVVPHGEEA